MPVHADYDALQRDEQCRRRRSSSTVKPHLPTDIVLSTCLAEEDLTFIGIPVTVVKAKLCCFRSICNMRVNNS